MKHPHQCPVPRGSAVPVHWWGSFEVKKQMRDQNKQLCHKGIGAGIGHKARGTKLLTSCLWNRQCTSQTEKSSMLRQSEGRKKPLRWTPDSKSPVMFCSKGIRNELSTVLPGSVLSPLCGLCSLHPLWWAWFCCSTFHSTEFAVSVSPPAQSQTPAGHKEREEQWLHHSRTPGSE